MPYIYFLFLMGFLNPMVAQQTIDIDEKSNRQSELQTNSRSVNVNFTIKNNSKWINSYYVKGPNNRGGTFSYGFKMFPFTTRPESWPVGTIVYEQSRTGKLTELIIVSKKFQERIIDLYK